MHSHTFGYMSWWLPVIVCKIMRVKVIYTPHLANEFWVNKFLQYLFKFLIGIWQFRTADKVIALTKIETEIIKTNYSKKNNVVIIPNGITIQDFTYIPRSELFQKFNIHHFEGKNILVSVARIAKTKWHIYLIDAFKDIKNSILILIWKDWWEQEYLEDYIRKNNIQNIWILNDVNDNEKESFLFYADLFILPSIASEAFGIVLLEAMQHGTPVVWTKTWWVPDVISTTVWSIAEPKNPQDLREKIVYELSIKRDPDIIKKYTYRYDWSNISKDILNTYTSLH